MFNTQQKFSEEQFQQLLPNLSPIMLQQLIAQARMKGISEQDIQNGLNYIQSKTK